MEIEVPIIKMVVSNTLDQQLDSFLELISQSPSIATELTQPGADPVAIAKEHGFSINAADFKKYHSLSDAELEQLSGAGDCMQVTGTTVCTFQRTTQC